ncbi:MAG TPA: TIGR00282 family metallophosphoesterase [Vicinamibacterales bacterium]
MNLLFVGDIVGRPGRELARVGLPALAAEYDVDLVIVNGENAAGGNGITREIGEALFAAGADVLTTGNHVWDKREVLDYIAIEPRLLRPANYPDAPGAGSCIVRSRSGRSVGVVNVMGRVHMPPIDDPFRTAQREVARLRERTAIIFVDFHAEATSEKIAMGWFLDGTVSAVVGTHTHVQTADARVLPGGTAYLTDVGMTGPHDGVIGVEKEAVIQRFLTGLPARFETATGDLRLHAALIDVDETTGLARNIRALSFTMADLQTLARDLGERAAAR